MAIFRNRNPSCYLPQNIHSEHYLSTKECWSHLRLSRNSSAKIMIGFQFSSTCKVSSGLKVQMQSSRSYVLLNTVSSFKSVLGILINLLSCFTKMQNTLTAQNKSESSYFTAPWVKSRQLWSTVRGGLFSSLKVREAWTIYSLVENENSTDYNFFVSSQILSLWNVLKTSNFSGGIWNLATRISYEIIFLESTALMSNILGYSFTLHS